MLEVIAVEETTTDDSGRRKDEDGTPSRGRVLCGLSGVTRRCVVLVRGGSSRVGEGTRRCPSAGWRTLSFFVPTGGAGMQETSPKRLVHAPHLSLSIDDRPFLASETENPFSTT
jgi:hypothetical protein